MGKKRYFLIRSNGDLSMTVQDLNTISDLIENDLDGVAPNEAEEFEYTITPVYYTDEEYEKLPEAE